MAKFKIIYYFDGKGTAIVEAENKEEAEEKFNNGETEEDTEESENYCIRNVYTML